MAKAKISFDIQRFATQADQTVHSGNTVLLVVNNQIIGRAQSLEGRRSFGTEGVYEIGSIMPQEHINNRYEGTVSMERFLIKKSDMAKAGLAALGEEILSRDIIDIMVLSKYTDSNNNPEVVRVYRGCTCVDYSETFRVGAISGENATFQYLSCDRGNSTDLDVLNNINGSALSAAGTAYRNIANASQNANIQYGANTRVGNSYGGISGYYEGATSNNG